MTKLNTGFERRAIAVANLFVSGKIDMEYNGKISCAGKVASKFCLDNELFAIGCVGCAFAARIAKLASDKGVEIENVGPVFRWKEKRT